MNGTNGRTIDLNDIPRHLHVTPYYQDGEAHDRDLALIKACAHYAYDYAREEPDNVARLLDRWSRDFGLPVNDEARLATVFLCQLMLEAYLRMDRPGWLEGQFRPWVRAVYRPCAEAEARANNNRGSWGLLGLVLSGLVLGEARFEWKEMALDHMASQWDCDGRMYEPPLRTRSGLWYGYFNLAPLLRVAQLGVVNLEELRPPLRWLWQYCYSPWSWPYLKPPWPWRLPLLRRAWYARFPCSDTLDTPSRYDWPANLYHEAGLLLGVVDWCRYAQPPLNGGLHIFRDRCRKDPPLEFV